MRLRLTALMFLVTLTCAGPAHAVDSYRNHVETIETPAGTFHVHGDARIVVNERGIVYLYAVEANVWRESNGSPGLQTEGDDSDTPLCRPSSPPSPGVRHGIEPRGCGVFLHDDSRM